MKPIKHLAWVTVLFATFSFGFLLSVEAADKPCDQWIAKAVSVQGIVEARKADQTHWEQVKLNDTFCAGDMIRVQENSRAAVVLSNETNLRLDQKTTITFAGIEDKKTFLLDLLSGAAHFFSRFPRSIKALTPFVNASVEGTEGFIRVEEAKAFLSIFEGKVLTSNAAGSLMLTGGQSAIAETGKTPELRVVVRPRNAVQWALYYPPVMHVPPGEAPKEDLSDPRFLAYRASRLLAVGRVDEAGADIERALSIDSNYSNAFALQSIVAVVQNEKEKALNSAQKAVDAGPTSAAARIAMSYARQAGFDLTGARTSAEEAIKLDPDNALAWARLAELWASFGRLSKALDAAKKAVELDPNLSRTQMVLGFAYLMQVNTTASKAAFEKAIELDQADPISRLGLGLAKIRDGDLNAGGREIEIAASLDPNNSLVRSYLGKTYFEEKRTDLDGREYAIAKELDPSDPTPWFYDAIRKQTINRPVEALHDLQKSIDLNDNRAVFRSRLLLDQDLAARSASLGRIFNNLGFQQLGLVEGWKSVNTAPADFSAHRLLADQYAVLPRHEIARVSELLQSQLLQPININSIQPRLAESRQFFVSVGGPAALSFNEFNPLFNRNRIAVQGSGLAGENDTFGGEGVVSGIYKKFSFSGGYTHFETDGFRENNDEEQDIYNVFAQMNLTYKTSVQGEYRYRDIEQGDLSLLFDPDNFFQDLRENENTESIRIGLHHAFGPKSNFIANVSYVDMDDDFDFSPGNSITVDTDGYLAEVQHLLQSERFSFTSGIGHSSSDRKEVSSFFPDPPATNKTDINHTNLYIYSLIHYPKTVTWTLGGSVDFFDNEEVDRDQFNPKFGLTWNPFPSTTLRGAVFRTLKRTLISDQTLEPTQVAGFNQFFDDGDAADVWRYGIGIDQKFSPQIYAGAEFSKRDLEERGMAPPSPAIQKFDSDEYLYRMYMYFTPHPWLAFGPEYQYERFENPLEFSKDEQIERLTTHRFSFGVNFSHPSGFNARLKPTYVDQDGKFVVPPTAPPPPFFASESGDDQFWIVDASIEYRMPKRLGLITIDAKNLFDEEFKFQDTDPSNPAIFPERLISFKVTLAF